MKYAKALLLLMILQAINSNCSDGCLKCDIANRCQVCDITSFYVEQNGVCVEKAPENCAMITPKGDCFQCKSSYFQEPKTRKCVKVPTDLKIEFCRFYKNSKECQVCDRGFYLNEGVCSPVEISVPGCLVHDKNKCIECEKGMILHPSRERCVTNPQADKCLVYGYLDCVECKPGYVLNSNYRVKNLLDNPKNGQIGQFLRSVTEGRVDFRLQSNCEPVSVPDCEVFETFSQCKQCRPFYLLTKEKKCKPYPLPSIPNCSTYGNYNLCLSCVQGYKLNSPSECIQVKPIQNCDTYSTTTSANICTQCQEGYYLFSNTCRERINFIEFCEIKNLSKDECQACKPGYVLTDDNLKCVTEVQNCASYQQSSSQTTQHTCVQCKDTFYLKENACIIGGIANCKQYVDQNDCGACQNGYYLNNSVTPNVCVQQTEIVNCNQYSNTVQDKCDVCKNDSVLVGQEQACTLITNDVSNCANYSDATTCDSCVDGYYLSNNSCQVIPEEQNCLQKVLENCVKCKEGFYELTGKCYQPIEYQKMQCLDWDQDDDLDTFKCKKCQQYTLPWTFQENTSLCATRSEIESRKNFSARIQNCLIHADESGTQVCQRCDRDYYISEDKKSCQMSCSNLTLVDQKMNVEERVNRCVKDDNLPNCSKAVVYKDKNVCIACKTGFMKSATEDDNKQLIGVNPADNSVKLGIHYLGFSCVQKQNVQIYETTQNQNPSPNCEAFTLGANNKLYCTRCKFGYTGNYLSENDPNLVNLRCDNKIKDCDNNTYYGGLLNKEDAVKFLTQEKYHLLNCHKCLTKGNIPFLFTDSQLDIKKFSLEFGNEKPTDQDMYNSDWLQCVRPSPESFKMTPDRFASVFPKNCGFGQFEISRDKDFRLFSPEFNSLKCLFCRPGFRPIYQKKDDKYTIVDCVEINKCEDEMMNKNQWFSSCSKCEAYHAWVYEQETEVVRYDQCSKTQDFNCMIVSNDNLQDKFEQHTSEKCLLCKPGYGLNYDGICEELRHDLCEKGQFQMDYSYFFDNDKIKNSENLRQLFGGVQRGCSRCKEGYEGIVWNKKVTTCLNSTFLLEQVYAEKTKYIPNCKFYYLNPENKLECQSCTVDYVPLDNKRKCIRKTSQPNCLVVDDDMEKCKQCEEGFVRVLGFCEKPQIKFCKVYDIDEDKQKCKVCEDTFALYNNHCYPGKVQNCQVYDEDGNCQTCYPHFQFLKLKDSEYCVPVPQSLNCITYEAINDDKRQLKCSQCAAKHVLTTTPTALIKSMCLPIVAIENCETYNNQILLSNTTLECTKCKKEFFLRHNQCLERKVQTQNCKSHALDNDYCQECLEGYYMTNKKQCQSYPTGIYGCLEYENETVCKSCQKNMYLSSNSCVKVPKQNRLANCDIYSDLGVCTKCQFNFYLQDNICVPAIAQNCMDYKNIRKCSDCPVGFGLKQNEITGTLDCVHISTQNCLVSKNVYPFDCIKCTKLFYEDKGRCFANDKFIPHCEEYLSRDTCKKCEDGFVLSHNNNRCLSSEEFGLEPSDACASNTQSQRPFCYVCEFGHKFYKNQCIKCRQQTLDQGCLYCEGLETEICLICKPGYFQDYKGECHRNGTTPVVDGPPKAQDVITDEQQQAIQEMNIQNEEKRQATTKVIN